MVDLVNNFWFIHIFVLLLELVNCEKLLITAEPKINYPLNSADSFILRSGKPGQFYWKDRDAPLKQKLRNKIVKDNQRSKKLDLTKPQMLQYKIWPRGIIPYFIDDFSFDKVLRDKIRYFLDQISTGTGLQFDEMQRPSDDDTFRWVFFVNRRGYLKCLDYSPENFTNAGVQHVVLGYDCLMSGGPLSAIILTLVGVPPQHNAPNRDDYIKVNQNNILSDKIHLFEAVKKEEWLFDDIEYDWDSAGHYDFYKYTKNGGATIEPKVDVNSIVGDPEWLSQADVLKIKRLYDNIRIKVKVNATKCWKLYIPGQNFVYQESESSESSKESEHKKNKNTDGHVNQKIESALKVYINKKHRGYDTEYSAENLIDRNRWNFRNKKHRAVDKNKLYFNIKYKSDYNTEEK